MNRLTTLPQAWQQNRLDLAENWLTKLETEEYSIFPSHNESLADLLYEIGKDQMMKAHHADAARWLEKALNMLNNQSLESLSNDSGELEIAILYLFARALLELPGVEAGEKVRNIVNDLTTRYGDKLAILLLRLDLFAIEPNSSNEDYYDILLRIVRTFHVTESALKTVMHHVHVLRCRSTHLAHEVLKVLLLERLSSTEQPSWVEKVLITIVWNSTTSVNSADHINPLQHLFQNLKNRDNITLGSSATYAAQVVGLAGRSLCVSSDR